VIKSLLLFLCFTHVYAQSAFESKLAHVAQKALLYLNKNISPPGTVPGTIVASPSVADPDYYFHWVRDAALTMRALQTVGKVSWRQMQDYINVEKLHQFTEKLVDQGEPKFHVNALAFLGPWGRPQNDGPALRATLMSTYVLELLAKGKIEEAKKIYEGVLPAKTFLKIDLEYVAHHYQEPDFDLWEEMKGQHFYTRSVQAQALELGAQVAKKLGDAGASEYYMLQKSNIEKSLANHWWPEKKIVRSTINQVEGLSQKKSLLDASVILAVIHTNKMIGDEKIQSTFFALEHAFKQKFALNHKDSYYLGVKVGLAIGRYPEDTYFGGHPWYLLTSGFAEYCYKVAATFQGKNRAQARGWFAKGDEYLARVISSVGPDESQAEQFHQVDSTPVSAVHLTWSYAAYLTAVSARNITKGQLHL
jgi:glucoamylase